MATAELAVGQPEGRHRVEVWRLRLSLSLSLWGWARRAEQDLGWFTQEVLQNPGRIGPWSALDVSVHPSFPGAPGHHRGREPEISVLLGKFAGGTLEVEAERFEGVQVLLIDRLSKSSSSVHGRRRG
ncbi:hypothetical protein [Streptomyces sp. NBC_01538]|uniref:hypothetical protein n=1 Tax=Streptomyces sp. NBC_01538 TaxID=2903897 RepID=UPI00386CDBF4